jgi:pilus assembly protein Flp/PilA
MNGLFGFVEKFACDERGAAAAEYALLLAIVAAGMAVAAGVLGSTISNALDNTTDCIKNSPSCSP